MILPESTRIAPLLIAMAALGLAAAGPTRSAAPADLTHFSIEDLMQVKVVSAAKVEQPLLDTAAAIFVITADDIRRSGATNVMEALRLAPGVEVARIDASRWAISIRGFNGRFANKLLVMIDGRTIYNAQFSGVYWEVQDLFLPDIERIEVIRGPGGSLWGANAVNGVINIITKNAQDTQGGLATLTVGDEERVIAGVRYGGKLGDNAQYRVYGQFTERDGLVTPDGRDAGDDWRIGRGGFRLDWTPSAKDTVAVWGDLYQARFDQNYTLPALVPPYAEQRLAPIDVPGGSLQMRWEQQRSATSRLTLQAYYQYEDRDDPLYVVDAETFDLEFQHNFTWSDRQEIVWGLGYRRNRDEFTDTAFSVVRPNRDTTQLLSAFVQDQVDLIPERLRLTAGLKVEHNDFTGWEWQPSLRMLWTPHQDHRLWAAVSRAVKTPWRGFVDSQANLASFPPSLITGNLPVLVSLFGGADLQSEELIAYEIGYRARLMDQFSVDATVFYNDYDRIIGTIPGTPFPETREVPPYLVLPLELANVGAGYNTGFELAADWRPTQDWRLRLAYSYLYSDLENQAGAPILNIGNQYRISLFSSWNPRDDLDLDIWWGYVNAYLTPTLSASTLSTSGRVEIDSHSTVNLRLGWRPRKDLELSLVGANLFGGNHLEFVQEALAFPVEIERSIYGQVKWAF
jgi:iron complex outermembrane receptor protein